MLVRYLSDVFEPAASPLGDPVGHLLVDVPVAVPDVAVQPDRERVGVQLGAGHGARLRHDDDEQGTPQQHGQQRPDGELVAAAAAVDPSVAVVAHPGAGVVRIAAVVVVRPGHVGRRDLVAGRPDYSNAYIYIYTRNWALRRRYNIAAIFNPTTIISYTNGLTACV